MTHAQTVHEPISGLHNDILWRIFSLNAEVDHPVPPWYPSSGADLSPLTITRRSSQVCSFWRSIILESPSIWGNCLDLDLLRQKSDKWRLELLRRTGTALLSVRSRSLFDQPSRLGKFTIDIICNHWARIKVLDIVIGSPTPFTNAKIERVFRSPSKELRVFSIQSVNPPYGQGSGTMEFRRCYQLFDGDAPLLSHFSISASILSTASLFPFPSVLLTGQLRHLILDQPLMYIPARELRTALGKMPLLEKLSFNVASMVVDNPTRRGQSMISLPYLKSINIGSFCIETFPELLGCITPAPACRWDMSAVLSSEVINQPQADEIQDIIERYMSSFFANGTSSARFLTIELFPQQLLLAAHAKWKSFSDPYFQTTFADGIPQKIRESFVQSLLPKLDYPVSLVSLQFTIHCLAMVEGASLAPLFQSLAHIQQLRTNTQGLIYIMMLEDQLHIFFPLLYG